MRRVTIVLLFGVFAIFSIAGPINQTLDDTALAEIDNADTTDLADGITFDFDDDGDDDDTTDLEARDRKCWKHFDKRDEKEKGDMKREGQTYCTHEKPNPGGRIEGTPRGSGFYWNVYIKAAADDDVSCSCLKGEIKKRDFCQAMTLWKCKHDANTRETWATFFESIFCNSERIVKAIEARTVPKIKTGCSYEGSGGDEVGRGASNAIAAAFNALGGAITRGRTGG